jgi:hypothetical protein
LTRIRTLSWLATGATAAALAATGSVSAASARTVNGTVGPGFTIGVTLQGKKVTRLKAGTAYRFVIADRSDIHDFHLSGPGVNRVLTSVVFTGTKSIVLRLKKGLSVRLRPPLRDHARPPPGLLNRVRTDKSSSRRRLDRKERTSMNSFFGFRTRTACGECGSPLRQWPWPPRSPVAQHDSGGVLACRSEAQHRLGRSGLRSTRHCLVTPPQRRREERHCWSSYA